MILAIPFLVIISTTLMGILFWDGMAYSVLGMPASAHDIIFIALLVGSIDTKNNKDNFNKLIYWFFAGLFVVQSCLQVFDVRPAGQAGGYDLFSRWLLLLFFLH